MIDAIGFFRELPHGRPDGASLREAAGSPIDLDLRQPVAHYLRTAPVLAATTVLVDDALDPTRTGVSGISIRTDGQSYWPEDLAYYVAEYGARIPDDVVARAALTAEVPPLTAIEFSAVLEEVRNAANAEGVN